MGRNTNAGGSRRGISKSRKRDGSKNKKSITYCNCKESAHFRNHCLKAIIDKGKSKMNVVANLRR